MNNIEILEELINDYRNCGLDDFPESVLDFGMNKSQIIAIKNLIQENKELKEKIKGMYDKSNKLIEVTNLYLNTSSKLERLENKIKMRIEQLESEFKEHEEKGLNGLIQKLDRGTRIEALKDLLKD